MAPTTTFATPPKTTTAPRSADRAILALAMLLPSLDTSIANTSLPTLAAAFGAGFDAVRWVVLAYLLVVTTMLVVAGRLGDRLGRRRLLLAGLALFTAASLLCGLAPSLGALIAARAVQGAGAAMLLAMTMALAGDVASRSRAGTTIGLLGTVSAAGTALGPSLGGVLAAAAGWRAIFLVNVPVGALVLVLALRHLPVDAPAPAPAPAVTGNRQSGAFGLRMLRDRELATGLLATTLVATVIMATLVVGPFHLARALGLAPAQVGFVMSVGPLVAALTGWPAGRLADRHGAARTARGGLLLMLAGCLGLALLPEGLGVPGYVAPLALLTAGYAMFQTGNNTVIMAGAGGHQRGFTAGLLSLARNVGLMAGVAGMGAIFEAAVGSADVMAADAAAVADATHVVFAVGGAVVLAASAAVRRPGRARRPRNPTRLICSPDPLP